MRGLSLRRVAHLPLEMVEVMRVEHQAYSASQRWVDGQYEGILQHQTSALWAAEYRSRMVGTLLFSMGERAVLIHRLAVIPSYWGQGVGKSLIQSLNVMGEREGAERIDAMVHEEDLSAQHLFAACGYRAINVRRGYHGDRDAYKFRRVIRAVEQIEQLTATEVR